jgi:hypothetical protein
MSDERRTGERGGSRRAFTGASELSARARLDADPLRIARLVSLELDHRCRALGAGTLLVDQTPELLVEALLAPPLAAYPPLVTHLRPPPLDRGSSRWSHF